MFRNLLNKLVGDPNEKEIKQIQPLVDEINALEPAYGRMSDEALHAQTNQFRTQIREAVADVVQQIEELQAALAREAELDLQLRLRQELERLEKERRQREENVMAEILPDAFAAVREASKRTLGLRHYDVQLIGGIVLHQGKIAEMKTGEGKTLVATLPLYLNALAGRGVHLVTPNDYLSKVGVQWMGPIYHLLGLEVAVIQSSAGDPNRGSYIFDPDFQTADDRFQHLRPISRRDAYHADITYGTNNEFGFDYLRDNMVQDLAHLTQRDLYYAIVDEVDNILIDEARTPLIISGTAQESSDYYTKFAALIKRLTPDDYVVEERERVVTLTEEGINKLERWLGVDNLYSPEHFEMTPYIDNALRAHVLFKRDKDYIVRNGEVIIVDEFTGRLMEGRRYSEGLHQAIEAKEGVRVQRESLTMATITFQNYFRMYHKLAGMTGTAMTEAEEFSKIYNLDVVSIPTHQPVRRKDYADQVYKNQAAKYRAVVEEIVECHKRGQPVLVGTVAIETSEFLSNLLSRRGIKHEVLNAKQHEREATIIAQAGRPGAVTIATNMAGRGVDILLGGNPEGLARERLRRRGVDLTKVDKETWEQALAEAQAECQRDAEIVRKLGGLHVIGTERHEARRIDNQLRGRAGRQGDPGSSRFYVALDDELMRRFGGQSIAGLMERFGVDEDVPIEHNMISKAIENAQVKVEGYNFDIRKHVLEYDDVVNNQREVIYAQRRKILSESNLKPTILGMVEQELRALVNNFCGSQFEEEWDVDGLLQAVNSILPLETEADFIPWQELGQAEIEQELIRLAQQRYAAIEEDLGADNMRQWERWVMLRAVDSRWVRHLTDLDSLREGIGLRAIAQQDPLVSYKREAHVMYDMLLEHIRSDIVNAIFKAPKMADLEAQQRRQAEMARQIRMHRGAGAASEAVGTLRKTGPDIGRNDPCWCGSGKKYKQCHLRIDQGQTSGEGAPVAAPAGAQTGVRLRKKRRKR